MPEQCKELQTKASKISEVIAVDLWGPARKEGLGGITWYVAFTDMKTWHTWVCFLKGKTGTKVLSTIKWFTNCFENGPNQKVKMFQIDTGMELLNSETQKYFNKKGIKLQVTAPYTSKQNGIAERFHHTALDLMRTMTIAWEVPWNLWPEAIAYAVYIKNQTPMHSLSRMTPNGAFYSKKPDVSQICEFGCDCWVLNETDNNRMLQKSLFQPSHVHHCKGNTWSGSGKEAWGCLDRTQAAGGGSKVYSV